MYIYADVIFIINIIMNSIILLLTALAAGIKYKLWRIIVASAAGSGYVLAGMLPGMVIFHQPLYKILVSFFLILMAFGFKTLRRMFILVAFFYVIAFILGGAVAGWLYFWQTNNLGASISWGFTNFSWIHLVLGTCVGVLLIGIILRSLLPHLVRSHNLYQVKIEYEGRTVEVTGMLDTGNGLYTMVGRKPVIIVNQSALEPMLSEKTIFFLRNNSPEDWLTNLDTCLDLTWLARIQVIPYHGIGSEGILLSFKPDRFMVVDKVGMIEISDVVIGIYNGKLASDGEYVALLHSQIITKLSKKEGVNICA